jgi:diguanylate cyclase (GGDEF)-like protein
VSRFGGDEFVILLVGATPADGEAASARISRELARPFERAGGVSVRASIGLSYAGDLSEPEDLIRAADRAMYQVKATHTGSRFGVRR